MTFRAHLFCLCYLLIFSTRLRELLSDAAAQEPDVSPSDDLLLSRQPSLHRASPPSSMPLRNQFQFPTASMQRPAIAFPHSRETRIMSHGGFLWWNQTKQSQKPQTAVDRAKTPMDSFVGPDGKLHISICDHPNGFLRWQKNLCRQYLHLMESVIRGYFMGLRECEYRFAAHRWNCQGHNKTLQTRRRRRLHYRQSRIGGPQPPQPKRVKTYLDKLLGKGTKEAAYVLAVTSAGVSHAVTKACSTGLHDNCGCDRTVYDHPREPNFEWSGCSDNIHFGAAFSRQFLDVRERARLKRKPKLGMTNLHNNHVGRQAVINKMQVQCKCHGVSGSCEMRTCWRSLPKFRELGAYLQERFHHAIPVDYVNKRLVPVGVGSFAGDTAHSQENQRAPTENDLIYITQSPSFCHHEPRHGSIGTYRRRCEDGKTGLNSCQYLCCDRGFQRQTFVQEERCNCKFQWCCKVVCQTCRKNVVVSTCN